MSDSIQPVFPTTHINIQLRAEGIFAFPEEWKTTDEANPGMFTYVIKFANSQIANGKILPRQMTEKQLRQQQSKKKGGKKEGKKQDNPAQAQKLKEQQEKQEQEERKKLEEWNKLSEEEQFYSASEDCYKSALLKFDPNYVEINLSGKAFVAFEEHVLKDGGQWVYIIKMPTANQQELAKLKKAKPKTLANANDLNPVVMRAWIDLSSLRSTSTKQTTLRCNLQQIQITDQSPKPALQKAYVKLNFVLNEPLMKKIDENSSKTMIKDPTRPPEIPKNVKCVEDLKQQIKIALQSLAMEYSAMFQKELNMMEEQKLNQIFINSRKNEPGRRKQQFLYDFNISGKYRVLKERLKKVIVSLCENKFSSQMNGAKSFTGVTCSMRDQFYSEIYDFLVTQYAEVMSEVIQEKRQLLNEVYVLKKQYQQKMSEEHLQGFIQESRQQRLQRIICEHLQVGNAAYGAELYQKQIKRYPDDITLKYQYALYCLRNGLKSVKSVIAEGYIEKYIEKHKQESSVRMIYVLLMIASEVTANLNRAWIVLRQMIEQDKKNTELLLLGAVLFEVLKNQKNSDILLTRAGREQLRKKQKLKQEGKHREDPQASQIPSLNSLATYEEQLSEEEKDELWINILDRFSQLGLMNIVEIIKNKLSNQESVSTKKQNLKILISQKKYEECQEQASILFKETKDMQIFNILITCLSKLNNLEETQKYLKFALKVAPGEQKINVLLKLGYVYLKAQKYGNAKACLVKYLEKAKPCGGLSWQILGNAQLKIGNYNQAIKSFRFSNLSDPYNPNIWVSMAEAFAGLGNLVMVNQCLNSFEGEKSKIPDLMIRVSQVKPQIFYGTSMKAKILVRSQEK